MVIIIIYAVKPQSIKMCLFLKQTTLVVLVVIMKKKTSSGT